MEREICQDLSEKLRPAKPRVTVVIKNILRRFVGQVEPGPAAGPDVT
jgi:hypothetical protein